MELKYKFSYGNIFKYFASHYVIAAYHFFIFLLLCGFVVFVYMTLGSVFSGYETIYTFLKILAVSVLALGIVYLFVILCMPKRAIISDNFLKVKRHFLNFSYPCRGFNDEIFIKDIIECKKYDGERYRFNRTGPYAVFYFDWDDLVEINTKDDKTYLVPIQNSDEFIEELNARIQNLSSN